MLDKQNQEKVKILLVDDRKENLLTLEATLANPGYELIKLESGNEVLRHLLHHDAALILMDVQMPGMGGFEATAAIRARERETGHHVRIVAMTAHAMNGDRERCLAA